LWSCIALLSWLGPLLELLLDSRCDRVDLAVGSRIRYQCRSEKLTWIVAFKGRVASLSLYNTPSVIVVATVPLRWLLQCKLIQGGFQIQIWTLLGFPF
jgi:hypothetical protein